MKKLLLLLLPIFLLGCENEDRVRNICKNAPQLCNDLNSDGWCRFERTDVIRNRFFLQESLTDLNKYNLLESFQIYRVCIELAAQIEPKKNKDRKTQRVQGYLTADREIERLIEETKDSKQPHLAYYHWRVMGSEKAKQNFLSLEHSDELKQPDLIVALATYYFEDEPEKTIQLLYKAIIAYDDNPIPAKVFESLTTLHLKLKHYNQAHVWAMISKELGSKSIDDSMIERYHRFTKEEISELNDKADELLSKINKGKFKYADVNE